MNLVKSLVYAAALGAASPATLTPAGIFWSDASAAGDHLTLPISGAIVPALPTDLIAGMAVPTSVTGLAASVAAPRILAVLVIAGVSCGSFASLGTSLRVLASLPPLKIPLIAPGPT